ncbi:MAG: universal stress protein [Thermomicrobiales bacterium]|nr:universal stress protein [Thermomicrobiales bacterium]
MSERSRYLTHLLAVTGDERTDDLLIAWSATLAAALHLPLTLVRVVGEAGSPDAEPTVVAEDTLAILASDARLTRVDVRTRVLTGDPLEVVPEVGRSTPGSLLILVDPDRQVGEAGEPRRFLQELDALTTPFVVIPPGASAPSQINRIVVGNDRSALAEAVLRVARQIAHSLAVDVIEVEAIEPDTIDTAAFLAQEPQIAARSVRARGLASRVMIRTAQARDAALIVVGSHGIGRGASSLAGRTTEWLIAHADRPVVVVPEVGR